MEGLYQRPVEGNAPERGFDRRLNWSNIQNGPSPQAIVAQFWGFRERCARCTFAHARQSQVAMATVATSLFPGGGEERAC